MVSIDDDARTVGEYMRHGGGWGIGFRVAKWCELGKPGRKAGNGTNVPIRDSERRAAIVAKAERGERVSVREFAFLADVSNHRIARYLSAWDAAAKELDLPPSSEILPEWTQAGRAISAAYMAR